MNTRSVIPIDESMAKRRVRLLLARALRFCALGLVFCVTIPANATIYYVAPNGHDSNPGTEALPWRTIQMAANSMAAGDTVYIRTGTYGEAVAPRNSGAPGAYITYAAYPGESPTIDGTGITLPPYSGLIDVIQKSYIRIAGLSVTNSGPNNTDAGINVDGSDNIIIANNSTYRTRSSGIGVWSSSNVVVSGNDIRQCCMEGGINECISIGTTNGFEVKNNTVHDGRQDIVGGEGIDIKDGSSNGSVHHNEVYGLYNLGIYLEPWNKHTFNIEVYANVVHDLIDAEGIVLDSEMGGLLENVRIYNNLVYDNGLNGLVFGYYGGQGVPARPVRNVVVINNTIHNNGRSGWGGGITVDNPDAQDIVLRNNIVSRNTTFQINVGVSVPGLVIEHNLIDGFRGFGTETRGNAYQEGDAGFVSSERDDFHLVAGSMAIDSGSSLGAPAVDFDGNARPSGRGYDMGAFEYRWATRRNRAVHHSGKP